MSLGVTWGVSSSLRRGCSRNPMFSGPTRPVSFSPKRIAADRGRRTVYTLDGAQEAERPRYSWEDRSGRCKGPRLGPSKRRCRRPSSPPCRDWPDCLAVDAAWSEPARRLAARKTGLGRTSSDLAGPGIPFSAPLLILSDAAAGGGAHTGRRRIGLRTNGVTTAWMFRTRSQDPDASFILIAIPFGMFRDVFAAIQELPGIS